jgi:hypothetical protein
MGAAIKAKPRVLLKLDRKTVHLHLEEYDLNKKKRKQPVAAFSFFCFTGFEVQRYGNVR